MTRARLLVIAAGGTGGHMFPAQSLAEEMLKRGWRVKLSTDARGARYTGGFPAEVDVVEVNSATFSRGGVVAKLVVPLRIFGGAVMAWISMLRDRPSVVVGFGGYPAIPAMLAARLRGVPRVLHEQNGVLGRVNKVFARRVDAVACGTNPTELPKGVEGVFTGNPVRAKVLEFAGATYTPAAFGPIHIVVIGGSQGARILSDVVPAAVAGLPENIRFRVIITQQARAEDQDRVRKAYADIDVEADVSEFIDDVPAKIAEAQVVISRAGASSVADIAVIGRPSILIPYAAATGDHQTANAKGLEAAGAAVVFQERDLTAQKLSLELTHLLKDDERAVGMARGAVSYGKPAAAAELADLVEGLCAK